MKMATFESCKTGLSDYERMISVDQILSAQEEAKVRLPFSWDTLYRSSLGGGGGFLAKLLLYRMLDLALQRSVVYLYTYIMLPCRSEFPNALYDPRVRLYLNCLWYPAWMKDRL